MHGQQNIKNIFTFSLWSKVLGMRNGMTVSLLYASNRML